MQEVIKRVIVADLRKKPDEVELTYEMVHKIAEDYFKDALACLNKYYELLKSYFEERI